MSKKRTARPELLHDMMQLKVTRDTLEQTRRQLTQKGWDRVEVDAALWHKGVRDRKNRYALHRVRKFAVMSGIVLGLLVIVGGSLYVDRYYKDNGISPNDTVKEVDVGSFGGSIKSQSAAVEFSFPSDWELVSKPDGTPGQYIWQIEPITNRTAREKMAERYVQDSESPSLDTSSLAILAGSGGERVYAVTVSVFKAPENTVEPSLDAWREKIVNQQQNSGYSVDGFEKVTLNGKEAYRFASHIQLAQINVSTQGYVFIEGDRRIELTVLPENSDRSPEINSIINSLKIL